MFLVFKKNKKNFPLLLAVAICFIFSCKKKEEVPPNPYEKVIIDTGGILDTTPGATTITGLHKNIFLVKCALDACHGGRFEPDFRTVQSSYTSLVYHPVEKNTVDNVKFFTYRVIPFDTSGSFIHERITTQTTEYMPSNGVRLSQTEIEQINTWIMNGAKDINEKTPPPPNKLPTIGNGTGYYIALDSVYKPIDTLGNRIDSIWYNAFNVQPNSILNLAIIVSDDSTAVKDMQLNQMKFSLNKDDFSSPVYTATATFLTGFDVWLITLNTSLFAKGSTVYFRYYINDGDHAQNVEYPRNDVMTMWKTYFSFYIKP